MFAIEEPELFLAPHAHRYLRRLIRRLAAGGNQIFFTTHAPGLLSLAALDEVNLVSRDDLGVTAVERLRPIRVDDAFRVMCEFDAERSELFLSRAAILVEGMTEKISLPFVFRALGYDSDGEQISIVECGGKANMPLFIEICLQARVPFVVVHDSDLYPGHEPLEDTVKLNALIRKLAGARRTVVLEPDFEGVAGFHGRDPSPTRLVPPGGRAAWTSCRSPWCALYGSRSTRPIRANRRTAELALEEQARVPDHQPVDLLGGHSGGPQGRQDLRREVEVVGPLVGLHRLAERGDRGVVGTLLREILTEGPAGDEQREQHEHRGDRVDRRPQPGDQQPEGGVAQVGDQKLGQAPQRHLVGLAGAPRARARSG